MLALNDVMNSEQNIPKIVTISIPLNVTGASTATSCVKKDNNHKLLINNDFKILQNIVVKTITQDGAVCIQNVNQVSCMLNKKVIELRKILIGFCRLISPK